MLLSTPTFAHQEEEKKEIARKVENLKTQDIPAFEERLKKEVGHQISLKPDWKSLKDLKKSGFENVGSTLLTFVSISVNKEVPEALTALKKIKTIELAHLPKQSNPLISKISKNGVIKVTADFSEDISWEKGKGPSAQLVNSVK